MDHKRFKAMCQELISNGNFDGMIDKVIASGVIVDGDEQDYRCPKATVAAILETAADNYAPLSNKREWRTMKNNIKVVI